MFPFDDVIIWSYHVDIYYQLKHVAAFLATVLLLWSVIYTITSTEHMVQPYILQYYEHLLLEYGVSIQTIFRNEISSVS